MGKDSCAFEEYLECDAAEEQICPSLFCDCTLHAMLKIHEIQFASIEHSLKLFGSWECAGFLIRSDHSGLVIGPKHLAMLLPGPMCSVRGIT